MSAQQALASVLTSLVILLAGSALAEDESKATPETSRYPKVHRIDIADGWETSDDFTKVLEDIKFYDASGKRLTGPVQLDDLYSIINLVAQFYAMAHPEGDPSALIDANCDAMVILVGQVPEVEALVKGTQTKVSFKEIYDVLIRLYYSGPLPDPNR